MLFIEKIKILKRSTGMYIEQTCLSEAITFVCGMQMMDQEHCLDSFKEWLIAKKSIKEAPFTWPYFVDKYVEERGVETSKQVQEFFDLLIEYLEDKGLMSNESEI